MTTTLVALYDDVSTAHEVVQHLVRNGFARDDISVIARDVDSQYASYVDTHVDDDNEIGEGAGIGAIIGGIGGLLLGLGALAIPGIGPVVAAGPIVAGLTGAGLGAVAGGVVGALVDMGLPEPEAERYAEGLRRGGTLVTAQVADERVDLAMEIMDQHHPIDLKERSRTWQESGWQGFSPEADVLTSSDIEHERSFYGSPRRTFDRDMTTYDETRAHDHERMVDSDEHIDIVEEEVKIGKRQVDRGGVRVHTYVVERPVEEDVILEETRVNVERRNVDRPASQADLDAFQERTIEVNETAEELIVNKEARVTGEVHINKEREQRTEHVRETARRTEVDVEHVGDVGDYTRYEPQFQRHYQSTYGTSGRAFDDYSPAYRYGYQLANDVRYTNRPWSEIEREAQRDWNDRYYSSSGSAWDQVKDAVRHGWEQVRNG